MNLRPVNPSLLPLMSLKLIKQKRDKIMKGQQFTFDGVVYIFHTKIERHINKKVPGWVCSRQGTPYSKFFSDEELRAIAS